MDDRELIIIKLGGSAITEKSGFKKPRIDVIKQIAKELSDIKKEKNPRLIIVTGGGSFGHPLARKYRLNEGLVHPNALIGVSETIDAMRELSLIVSRTFREANLPCVPIQPSAIATNKGSKLHRMDIYSILKFLSIGAMPLLWGDVVFDEEMGVSILSGDEIVSKLAVELNANKIIYGLEVDGLYNNLEKKILVKTVSDSNLEDVIKEAKGSSGTDVTGGMLRKLTEALTPYQHNIPIYLINITTPQNLYRVIIKNENVGTLIFKQGNFAKSDEEYE
ncbi:MAG: isopentenyl phosphate kinase [Candidatus Njordarchaeia archaeon]